MQSICDLYEKEFTSLPEKVLQFGDGNFLRAFADWYIQKANEKGVFGGRVVIAQATPRGRADYINSQNSFYTVLLRGRSGSDVIDEAQRISSVSRCINTYENYEELLKLAVSDELEVIISNTTEAGIEYKENERLEASPNVTYPGKLTALLYERFKAGQSGLLILPVELIENNGDALKSCVLRYADDWRLGGDFKEYIENECRFCSTLVDRIVTGFPKNNYDELSQRLGYDDKLLTVCEPYNSWVIQGNENDAKKFPLNKAGLNIVWCDDLKPYRTRKVRILNGAHTVSVAAAFHSGFDIVRDMMNDEMLLKYIKKVMLEEIAPTIDLPSDRINEFANAVLDRFDNPFIDHKLLDISLNSVSKFKARCLCSLLDYQRQKGELPPIICFGFAALIYFYNGEYINGVFTGDRAGEPYVINDSKEVLDFFETACKSDDTVRLVLENKSFWDMDLTKLDGLLELVSKYYESIICEGMYSALKKVVENE